MGGGNAQKTATSRARHLAKEAKESSGGGGKAGMEARSGGNMAEAMAAGMKLEHHYLIGYSYSYLYI